MMAYLSGAGTIRIQTNSAKSCEGSSSCHVVQEHSPAKRRQTRVQLDSGRPRLSADDRGRNLQKPQDCEPYPEGRSGNCRYQISNSRLQMSLHTTSDLECVRWP